MLQKRRDVLKTRLQMVEAMFKNGRRPPEDVIAARDDLLDAEFEMAANKKQRIDVLQQKLANNKGYEALIKQRKKDARGTEAEVLEATARCLAIEIKILREQK